MTEKCSCLGTHLMPTHLFDDITNMRNKYIVYLPDIRIMVINGGNLIVHCCHEKLPPQSQANVLYDTALMNDLLNKPMNRHEISCWFIVIVKVDIVSSCSSDKRKL